MTKQNGQRRQHHIGTTADNIATIETRMTDINKTDGREMSYTYREITEGTALTANTTYYLNVIARDEWGQDALKVYSKGFHYAMENRTWWVSCMHPELCIKVSQVIPHAVAKWVQRGTNTRFETDFVFKTWKIAEYIG